MIYISIYDILCFFHLDYYEIVLAFRNAKWRLLNFTILLQTVLLYLEPLRRSDHLALLSQAQSILNKEIPLEHAAISCYPSK